MIPWEKIKEYWRNKFSQTEIYTDENEHIIIFKSNDNFIILGYLHCQGRYMSVNGHINFINFIKKFGNKNYNPFKIYLLCNYNLSNMENSRELLSLLNDVEYYYVNYNSFYETIDFKLEDKTQLVKQSNNLKKTHKQWYFNRHIQVITDSRFEDWGKWANKNYEREWYSSYEDEKFDSYWGIDSIISVSEIYIDDRFLLGFYLVWKYDGSDKIDEIIDSLDL